MTVHMQSTRFSKLHPDTHLHLHFTSSSRSAHRGCVSVQWCNRTSEFQLHARRSTRLENQSTHVIQRTMSEKLFALDVTSREPHQGGYAGVRKRRIQNHPKTKEILQNKNPLRVEHVSTRRMTQFQEAKTPSREEFGIYNL